MSEIINVTRSSIPEFEEYCNEIRSIWDSHWLTNMGEKHQRLEAELKEYLGVQNVALLTNGHLALENIIEAMELKGEIITTPFTFASTTHAIVRCGCTPVFCDIDPTDYTIDAGKLESLITDKTVAIMPVHVYGNLCNVEEIDRIAKKHGLKVIYDAAHAFGVTKNGISSACFGDAAMFSFHATKVFNTIEGGALCFKDEALAQRIRDLKNFGIQGPEDVEYIGGNAKMNEFCAAMGLCNLRHLDGWIAERKLADERQDAHEKRQVVRERGVHREAHVHGHRGEGRCAEERQRPALPHGLPARQRPREEPDGKDQLGDGACRDDAPIEPHQMLPPRKLVMVATASRLRERLK